MTGFGEAAWALFTRVMSSLDSALSKLGFRVRGQRRGRLMKLAVTVRSAVAFSRMLAVDVATAAAAQRQSLGQMAAVSRMTKQSNARLMSSFCLAFAGWKLQSSCLARNRSVAFGSLRVRKTRGLVYRLESRVWRKEGYLYAREIAELQACVTVFCPFLQRLPSSACT